MFYWVKLHHWKLGDAELQHEKYEVLTGQMKPFIDDGWTVVCMKTMNRKEV